MKEEKSLQANTPSVIQTPPNGANPQNPLPPPHIPLPTPEPKKSLLKKPLFWITVIILFIFAGAYLFIYSSLENSITTLEKAKTASRK